MRAPISESKKDEQLRIVEEQKQYYSNTMDRFERFCVVCYPNDTIFGVTVHEVEPRSKHPKDWWLIPDNGCPLCVVHHDYVHTLSLEDGIRFCRENMARCLQGLGKS